MSAHRTKSLFSLALLVCAFAAALPSPAEAAVPGGPFVYHALTPCRLIDTRNGQGDSPSDDGPVGARTSPGPYDVTVKSFCGVPLDAEAVTINITVVGPTSAGDLRTANLDANPFPIVSTLNYIANEPALANGAIVPLKSGAGNDLRMVFAMVGSGSLHILVDVTGYFAAGP
jgi:hypothetical protein